MGKTLTMTSYRHHPGAMGKDEETHREPVSGRATDIRSQCAPYCVAFKWENPRVPVKRYVLEGVG